MSKGEKKKSKVAWGDNVLILLALMSSMVLVYLLFFHDAETDGKHLGEPLGIIRAPKAVRRRHARSLAWEELTEESPLYLRDIVYVPSDTDAEVIFGKDKRIHLDPDTMVQFDEVTVDALLITLFDGKAVGDVVVQEEQPKVVETPRLTPPPLKPHAEIPEIEDLLAAKQALDLKWKGKRPEAPKLGKVNANLGQEKDLNSAADYDIKLVWPKDEKYNLKANRWLRMEWTKIPLSGIEYVLEISQDAKFARSLNHTTKEKELKVQLESPGNYYWRVTGRFKGTAKESPVGHFIMTKVGGLGNARGDSRLVAGTPDGFVAEVAPDDSFAEIVSSKVITGKRCPSTGLSQGTYYCRIRSVTSPKVIATYQFEVK